jgi:hypothetical protein
MLFKASNRVLAMFDRQSHSTLTARVLLSSGMACPYFHPVSPDPQCSPRHATLPLGDAWSGLCHANPGQPKEPGVETLYPVCNIGYARERCPHFPAGDGPDAIRFSIASEDPSTLRVWYAVERDHLPLANGALEYSPATADFAGAPPLEAVTRLARAYVASYYRRRSEPSGR